ncbi:uncharacterized protein HaLaN_08959 [Haematococcus lacustris]|uniref:Uncharacterized protein n=1 Tax=Haematococcus lacustris TaxID=44745 RepID=A0A699YV76_HAELA|nr:uncharacterized protein HaLaN_08959 [Haematococcus lacustris]
MQATTGNTCNFDILAWWADPGYFEGDDDEGPGPLAAALRDKEAYQSIRALPADPGAAVLFTHRCS